MAKKENSKPAATSASISKEAAVQVPSLNSLLALSFIEGACVMVAELAGGKMLAPYYGTSLYVWASTLAITLGGLTIGYFFGGRLSGNSVATRKKHLLITIAIAATLVMVMPAWANFIMKLTLNFDFLTGLVIAQLLFLLPPVLGMGMVSPLIISLIGERSNAGKAAGSVYAISTLGGVIATLLTGFWLVPVIGISIPCIIIGGLLFVLDILVLKPNQKFMAGIVVLLMLPSVNYVSSAYNAQTDKYNVLYHSEGMLGQVKIIDFKTNIHNHPLTARSMLVNHNWQTWVDRDHPSFSFLYYTRFTNAIISSLPQHSNVLLIGLGGGTVARQLEAANMNYDAVEIDGRLPKLAKNYFGLKGTGNLIVDDGRHYINICKKKYDLIIIDALLGENVPSQLLSLECFEKLKSLLDKYGDIFIEFDGIQENEKGIAQRSLLYTIKQAGLVCQNFGSIPHLPTGDVMYLATANGNLSRFDGATIDSDFYYPYSGALKDFKITLNAQPAELLTDNNPALDFYLRQRMMDFRDNMLKKQNKDFLEDDMAFYY